VTSETFRAKDRLDVFVKSDFDLFLSAGFLSSANEAVDIRDTIKPKTAIGLQA